MKLLPGQRFRSAAMRPTLAPVARGSHEARALDTPGIRSLAVWPALLRVDLLVGLVSFAILQAAPARAADTTGLKIQPRTGTATAGAARDPFGREPVVVRVKPKPKPLPVIEAPPPPPTAPPLPYKFAGRITINNVERVLLLEGERVVSVAPGDTLGEFRFERDERSLLQFAHLPTGLPVTLGLAP